MNRTTWLQDRRMQKFRDVLNRWESGELSMMEAGEVLGMSERQFRRYRDRYEEAGEEGLRDRRLGKRSGRRVPAGELQRMLALYREFYGGWNVKHFHEHLQERHNFAWATPGRRRSCMLPDWSSGPSGAGHTGANGRVSRARA